MEFKHLHYYITEKQPVLNLARLWGTLLDSFQQITGVRLTPKEMGQLKFLRERRTGKWTALIMFWAVQNWQQFIKQARLEYGLMSAPPKPHIGFLVAHCDSAMSQMIDIAKKTPAALVVDNTLTAEVLKMEADFHQQYLEWLATEVGDAV